MQAGDRILAVIRGTAANQDGASSGFSVPNGIAQQALIRRALKSADVDPGEIDYVEAHGTGTALGDPIEAGALGAVLGQAVTRAKPLWLGSVKSNMGHLESAAGVTGLIKLVLALRHEQLPQTLHVNTPNPAIDWNGLKLKTVQESVAWPRGNKRRLAGLSSFGVSGSNAHLIVEEGPPDTVRRPDADRPFHVLAFSAKSQSALVELAAVYDEFLACQQDESIADICFSAGTGRNHFKYRVAICAARIEEFRAALSAFRQGQDAPGLFVGEPGELSARSVRISFDTNNPDAETLPPLDGPASDWYALFSRLATDYINGNDVDWAALDKSILRNRLHLPTYRFQRKRYWITERDQIMTPAPSTQPALDELHRHRESVKADAIGLVAELLREKPADVPLNVPFLELGADSLILVYAVRRIEERFGVKLEIRQFFEEITSVASLAEFVADHVAPPPAVRRSRFLKDPITVTRTARWRSEP